MNLRALLAVAVLSFFPLCPRAADTHPGCSGSADATFSFPGLLRPNVVVTDGPSTYVGTLEGGLRILANGLPDPTFRVDTRDSFDYPAPVYALATDSDDQWYVGGRFNEINDVPRAGIARLTTGTQADTTFAPQGAGVNGAGATVLTIAVQADERILIGGDFTHYDAFPRTNIARLNYDGTADQTFDPGAGANGPVNSIAVQPDGRILVAGSFVNFNNISVLFICRLLPNGALDSSFRPPPFSSAINGVHVLPDGKLLVHGMFSYSEAPATPNFIARLNADGTLDATFTPRVDGPVKTIALQADGKYLIGGTFQQADGEHHHLLARLLPSGRLDPTFESGIQMLYGCGDEEAVYAIALDPRERVLVGGSFFEVNGLSHRGIARLFNDNDSCPGLFYFESDILAAAEAETAIPIRVHRSGDGAGVATVRLHVQNFTGSGEGDFTPVEAILHFAAGELVKTVDLPIHQDSLLEPGEIITLALADPSNGAGLRNPNFIRVTIHDDESAELPGSIDLDFNPEIPIASVIDMERLPNGQLLLSGYFDHFNPSIIRLNTDGSLDPTFNFTVSHYVGKLAAWSGKVYVLAIREGGSTVIRLNNDGTLDNAFIPPRLTMWNHFIGLPAIAAQADGKVLIGGAFTAVNDIPRGAIVRLNTDGSVDTSFDPGAGVEQLDFHPRPVNAIHILGGSSILVAGRFKKFNGVDRASIAHVSPTGAALNDYFLPQNISLDNEIWDIAQQPDGKILVAGDFYVDFAGTRDVFRFTTEGVFDTSFEASITSGLPLTAIAADAAGRIYVGALRRLLPTGQSDPAFYFPDVGRHDFSELIALPDGDVLVSGNFADINGLPRPGLARINGGAYTGPGVITAQSVTVIESAGAAIVRVAREWSTAGEAVVRYATVGRDAQPGRDYLESTGTLTFSPGVSELQISIPIVNDQESRGSRTFGIQLDPITPGMPIFLPESEALVRIEEDDTEFVLTAPYEIAEIHERVFVYVTLEGPFRPGSVRLEVSGGTATQGTDYIVASQIVEFTNGASAAIPIELIDDAIPEGIETIQFRLRDATGGIILGSRVEGELRLVDNANHYGFPAAELRAHESSGVARVWVHPTLSYLQPEAAPPFVVNFRTTPGTAQPGVDYTPIQGQLTFGAREMSPRAIHIPLIRDREATGSRTVQVELTSVSGEAVIDRSITTLTIVDDQTVIPAGALDPRFQPLVNAVYPSIYEFGIAPYYLYAGGYFVIDDETRALVRFHPDGRMDETYRPNLTQPPVAIRWVGGKLLVAGHLEISGGREIQGVARFNGDGSVDDTFNATLPVNFVPRDMTIDYEDRIIIVGYLSGSGGNQGYAVRLHETGGIDGGFAPVHADLPQNYAEIQSVAVTVDRKILIGGTFTRLNGESHSKLVRLNPNGSIDTTFRAPQLDIGNVYKIIPLEDRKLYIHGPIFSRTRDLQVVRLNEDGSHDTTFEIPEISGTVYDVTLNPLNGLLIAGDFVSIAGTERRHIARLLADGRPDDSFFPPSFDGGLNLLAYTVEGIYVSGGFLHVNDEYRPILARLHRLPPVALAEPIVANGTVSLYFNFSVFGTYIVESTPEFGEWTEVARGQTQTGNVTVQAPATERALFYRVRNFP